MFVFHIEHLHYTFSFYSKVTLTMSMLRQNTNSVKDVNPKTENWILIARVIHLWFASDFKKTKFPFSMEMVIQDKYVNYFIIFFLIFFYQSLM